MNTSSPHRTPSSGSGLSRRGFFGLLAPAALGLSRTGNAGIEPLMPAASDAAVDDEAYWGQIQQAFTVDRSIVHLNNGGVNPSPAVVQEAHLRHLSYAERMPFYVHRRMTMPQLEAVRAQLARAVGCDAEELALTRNTSEGMEICQLGIDLRAGDEVVTTDQDYPRMIATFRQRVARHGIVLKQFALPVPAEDPDEIVARFEACITPRTRLLMLCHMIDLTGQIMPVRAVTAMARRRGIPVLVDGAQTFGHLDFRMADLGCDFYATSLHKGLMGPHGTGFLFVRRERIPSVWPLMPAEDAGAGDIRKFEDVGTRSLAGFLAGAEALAFNQAIGAARKEARLRYLRDRWVYRLLAHDRVRLHTSLDPAFSCGLTTVSVDGIDPIALRDYLWNTHRVVVRPIRHPAVSGIRVSPGLYTTLDELDRFVEIMESIIKHDLPGNA
ncbi:MAG: aminotransferase class V-fold PLP-dependent enzyme [Rhodothermales bacterium]